MNTRIIRLTAVPLAAAALALVTSVASPAHAQSLDGMAAADHAHGAQSASVYAITDGLARRLAILLADDTRLVSAAANAPVDLMDIEMDSSLAEVVRAANRDVLTAKGLPASGASLLRVRLADAAMRSALYRGEAPLVAAAPTDDTAAQVIAYDRMGGRVFLDAVRVPERPVLVVEVNTAKALPLGLAVMRDTLDASGITSATVTATSGYWATKVNAVRLSDDKEPWIKGAAEIFNVVGGFGLDGKVKIDTVQMPYLDYDGTTYYPNQLLVHFSAYKYNLADVVMMEDDGDTNYLSLAQAIASALLYIVDGGAYTPLVNAILAAMPDSWWTDDPDYVDSWYTLATTSSGRLNGAAANGWMDVVPYWVEQF